VGRTGTPTALDYAEPWLEPTGPRPPAGGALPAPLRAELERVLGRDLSAVTVSTSPASAQTAARLGASAFTIGRDIHFAEAQFDAASTAGRELLLHELIHAVQSSGAGPDTLEGAELSRTDDPAELEADHLARDLAGRDPAAPPRPPRITAPLEGAGRKIHRRVAFDTSTLYLDPAANPCLATLMPQLTKSLTAANAATAKIPDPLLVDEAAPPNGYAAYEHAAYRITILPMVGAAPVNIVARHIASQAATARCVRHSVDVRLLTHTSGSVTHRPATRREPGAH
jgi:hypothetical protein